MKKLVFLFLAAVALSSCSINDDDAPNIEYEPAEITGNDLPDQFELGKTYTVTVTYVLPSECNSFAGIQAQREGNAGADRRQIYIAAFSQVHSNSNCDDTMVGESGTGTFNITIDENEDFTFYFWTGTDASDQPIYDQVTVPVTE